MEKCSQSTEINVKGVHVLTAVCSEIWLRAYRKLKETNLAPWKRILLEKLLVA